jgi:outer membrane receptor for ferrienterochelin and colicins
MISARMPSHLASLLSAALTLGVGLVSGTAEAGQSRTGTVRVEVVQGDVPVAGATVSAGGVSAATDASGVATLALPPGAISVSATKVGYETASAPVDVVAGSERVVRLVLTAKSMDADQTPVVASTRTGLRINEQAVPIDVLRRDTIEANMLITPGNVARSLNAISGVHVVTTSPELGLAVPRIRGLRGQYTRLLSDGVPLYFDLPGGLAPVQIAPMDLDRIEVVSAGASALFGVNALAGAVNLLSRRPGTEPKREFLIGQSTEDATDAAVFLSSPPSGSWSRTFLASVSRQDERDVDGDGWSDIAGYRRGGARQRVFWDNRQGKSVDGTAGVTFEKREGGSSFAHQELETKTADGQMTAQMPWHGFTLAGTGMLYVQSRTRDFSDGREHERREAATIEIELRGTAPRQTWVAGIAVDWFTTRSHDFLAKTYLSTRPGLFVQDDVKVAPWLSVSGSARVDHHNIYGIVLSPQGSALVHRGPWEARVSAGQSYSAPTPLMEETEAAGLTRLSIADPLEKETARSVSADFTHRTRASVVTFTVFHNHIDHPALIDRATYTLRTEEEPVETQGVEILATVRRAPFSLTGTYTYVDSRELDGREIALTPRHSAGLIATAEAKGRGRVGVQVYYTGVQRLDANPYRSKSEPYTVTSLLGELQLGRWRVFVTADNVTDVRQTDWDPIARPTRDGDGRWTVDAWAPLAGRVVNGGLRILF